MKGKRNGTCAALLCLVLASPIGAKAEKFSDVFVFGNSLSDTGNAAVLRNFLSGLLFEVNLCHPEDAFPFPKRRGCGDLFFEETRVSNGPVAVEVATQRLGLGELQPSLHPLFVMGLIDSVGTNFAVAGATARGSGAIDLENQVIGFLASRSVAPADALYIVLIGGNDVIDVGKAAAELLTGSTPDETPRAIIADAVGAIGANIETLIAAGARRFLVVNAPNIGSIPAIRIVAEEEGIPPALLAGFATLLTRDFNRQLSRRMDQVRATQRQIDDLEIREFNLFRFFRGVRLVGRLFGLNAVDRCFDREKYQDTGSREFDPDCGPDKFDRFIFYDDIHPTGLTHRIVGNALSKAARQLAD